MPAVAEGSIMVMPSHLREWPSAAAEIETLKGIGIKTRAVEVPTHVQRDMFAEYDELSPPPVLVEYDERSCTLASRASGVLIVNKTVAISASCKWHEAVGPRTMRLIERIRKANPHKPIATLYSPRLKPFPHADVRGSEAYLAAERLTQLNVYSLNGNISNALRLARKEDT